MTDKTSSEKQTANDSAMATTAKDELASKKLKLDMAEKRLGALKDKAATLSALKITGEYNVAPEQEINGETGNSDPREPRYFHDEESVLMLQPANDPIMSAKGRAVSQAIYTGAGIVTTIWLAFCTVYIMQNAGSLDFSPQGIGALLAGVFAPPALFWLMLSSANRQRDVEMYASSLRGELQSLLFPSEENARVINKDIENLCRQAAEVSAASKAILKSLQRARQGLRVEIRDFSGVSKKAEFHIDRLAESLNDRTSKLITLTEEIEERTARIDEKTKEGAQAWDQATQSVLDRASEMETALSKGAEKILQAADQAKEKTDSIEEQMDKNHEKLESAITLAAQRLEGLNEKFDLHTSSLREASENISHETAGLGEMIQAQITDLEEAATDVVDKMSYSSDMIRTQREELKSETILMAEQAEHIASMVNGAVKRMNESVESSVDKSVEIQDIIEDKIAKMRETLNGISVEANVIEEAGNFAANKLGEALSLALSGSEQISSSVRRAVESLQEVTASAKEQADDLIVSTKNHVDELNAAGEGNVEHIQKIITMLESSKAQVEGLTETTKEQVEALSSMIEQENQKINVTAQSLGERITFVRKSLEEPLRDINVAIAEADSRHQQIEQTLTRRVGDLNKATERAVESVETIRGALRGQAQEMASLSGQIAGNARNINEQMVIQKDHIGEQVRMALSDITRVSDALQKQSFALQDVSEKACGRIEGLEGIIEARCLEITDFTTNAFKELKDMDQSLGGKITMLKDYAEEAMDSVITVKDALENTAQDIEPVYIRALEGASEAHAKFVDLKVSMNDATESNLEKLKQVGIVFDERLTNLKEGAGQAASILKYSSDHMKERVEDIASASKSASEKMRDISAALENQSSDIHLITDQALLKIESVQNAMNDQYHELSAAVGQAIAQLEDAGKHFVGRSDYVLEAADQIKRGFVEAGDKAREETDFFSQAAERSVENTSDMVRRMQEEAENMLARANTTLVELKKAGDTFAIRAREVEEHMKGSMQTSESYGQSLRAQAQMIAEASLESAERLGKAVKILTHHVGDIGSAANDATQRVEKTRVALEEESQRLMMVSNEVVGTVKGAASAFGKQSESLFKASQDAVRFTQDIHNTQVRGERDAFMSSAKFVIESLHSLSVDLTRMLDGEISEKTWKAFQKGDVGAFTRKLVQMDGQMPLDKARIKFGKDTEFRTYVQRYIRQFEELYAQAIENDHGALLSSTFASSEVGKLYQFLCDVSGREARFGKDSLKAA